VERYETICTKLKVEIPLSSRQKKKKQLITLFHSKRVMDHWLRRVGLRFRPEEQSLHIINDSISFVG
jgi:hypothetical protein